MNVIFDSYNGEVFYNDKMEEVFELLEFKNFLVEFKGV